jgi:hypothetical protein
MEIPRMPKNSPFSAELMRQIYLQFAAQGDAMIDGRSAIDWLWGAIKHLPAIQQPNGARAYAPEHLAAYNILNRAEECCWKQLHWSA